MAVDTRNQEGLTFVEWVCAAGLASSDPTMGTVKPYSTSYLYAKEHAPEYMTLRGHCYTDRRQMKRRTVLHYSLRVRKAWRSGEDPSEYRALTHEQRVNL